MKKESALVLCLAACGRPDAAKDVQAAPAREPVRELAPAKPIAVGTGHLRDGFAYASARLEHARPIVRKFAPPAWTAMLDAYGVAASGVLTASVARVDDGVRGVHVRLHAPASAPAEPETSEDACPTLKDATCGRLDHGAFALRRSAEALTIDVLLWVDEPDDLSARLHAAMTTPGHWAPPVFTALRGDLTGWLDAAALTREDPSTNPAALSDGRFAITRHDSGLELTASFTPADPAWFSVDEAARTGPTFAALCEGAWACARTQGWPTPSHWLPAAVPVTAPRDMVAWQQTIEHAHNIARWPQWFATTLQAPKPLASVSYAVAAWDGIGAIESAGARFDGPSLDEPFIAYARLPRAQVDLVQGLLRYAEVPIEVVEAAPDLRVSYARPPGLPGGLVLAIDDAPLGAEPATAGYLAWVSSPERFGWLQRLPHSRLGPPRARARASSLSAIPTSLSPYTLPGTAKHAVELELHLVDSRPTLRLWLDR